MTPLGAFEEYIYIYIYIYISPRVRATTSAGCLPLRTASSDRRPKFADPNIDAQVSALRAIPEGVHQKRQYEEQQPRGRSTRQAGRQRQRTVSQRRVRTLHIRQDSVIPDHGGRPSGNDKARGGPGGMADAPSTGVGVGEGLAPAGCIPPEYRRIARSLARRRMSCRAVVHLQATFGDSLPIRIVQASVI